MVSKPRTVAWCLAQLTLCYALRSKCTVLYWTVKMWVQKNMTIQPCLNDSKMIPSYKTIVRRKRQQHVLPTNGQTSSTKITSAKNHPAIFTLQFSPLQLTLTCKILHKIVLKRIHSCATTVYHTRKNVCCQAKIWYWKLKCNSSAQDFALAAKSVK